MSRFERYAEPPQPKPTARRWWHVSTTEESRTWDATDALILLGVGLVIAGVAWIHPPSALVLGGAVLVAVVILAGGKQ